MQDSLDETPQYYTDLGIPRILDSLKNLDDKDDFAFCDRAVCSPSTKNFVVDFSDDEAWCLPNVDARVLDALLNEPRPACLNTRWINIWQPYHQKDSLAIIAKYYDFSPRLLGLLCSDPPKRTPVPSTASKSQRSSTSIASWFKRSPQVTSRNVDPEDSMLDITLGSEERFGLPEMTSSTRSDIVRSLNQYALADDIWHYSSVDWGRRYVCIGYNVLYNTERDIPSKKLAHRDLPHGQRIWHWLILAEDKTVISITEYPFPQNANPLTMRDQRSLGMIRQNLVAIFRQCSKAYGASTHDITAIQLPIRRRVGNSEEETVHRPIDAPGLLFFYLFDDSFATYSVIARRRNRYALEIDNIRVAMLSKAQLSHVDELHHIGRQLAVLKRMYVGYGMIIDRLLEPREPTLASLKASQAFGDHNNTPTSSTGHLATSRHLIGVTISSAARVRFEKLKYSIQLYAVSEIEECIAQKDALVFMNFNLIAMKESFSVERLTRVTLVIGKASLLFMPVSIMTGYFSSQFEDAQFTVQSYWIWFAGVVSLSILILVVFSFASGTSDSDLVYRPLSRRIVDFTNRVTGRQGRKKCDASGEDSITVEQRGDWFNHERVNLH